MSNYTYIYYAEEGVYSKIKPIWKNKIKVKIAEKAGDFT